MKSSAHCHYDCLGTGIQIRNSTRGATASCTAASGLTAHWAAAAGHSTAGTAGGLAADWAAAAGHYNAAPGPGQRDECASPA